MYKKGGEWYRIPIDFISFLFVLWDIYLKRWKPTKFTVKGEQP
jgi:hypothetical protein